MWADVTQGSMTSRDPFWRGRTLSINVSSSQYRTLVEAPAQGLEAGSGAAIQFLQHQFLLVVHLEHSSTHADERALLGLLSPVTLLPVPPAEPPSQHHTSLRATPEQRPKELWVDRSYKGVRTAERGPSKGWGRSLDTQEDQGSMGKRGSGHRKDWVGAEPEGGLLLIEGKTISSWGLEREPRS